jgi:hypothetical protein
VLSAELLCGGSLQALAHQGFPPDTRAQSEPAVAAEGARAGTACAASQSASALSVRATPNPAHGSELKEREALWSDFYV